MEHREHRRYGLNAEPEFKEAIIQIRRVAKVVKGGKRMSFSALVAIGNKEGRIGLGHGKANEVPDAIQKAKTHAMKNLFSVKTRHTTIPHEVQERFKGAIVMLKPASKGTGVIAGGAVRRILELSPVKDVLAKSLGSSNQINVATATVLCLQSLRLLSDIAALRGKTKEEIYSSNSEAVHG